jgi:hypothetical protein
MRNIPFMADTGAAGRVDSADDAATHTKVQSISGSANVDERLRPHLIERGAVAYLSKPRFLVPRAMRW